MEFFETYTEDGRPRGIAARAEVHRRGLWHRAANVLLFDSDGCLILQRRAATKDVWPGAWDVSVGEHLRFGETFHAAASRGLVEELGIAGVHLSALGGVVSARVSKPGNGIDDRELQQTFTGQYDGPLHIDRTEVAEVRRVDRATLTRDLRAGNDLFTPWLTARLERLGWL